MPRCPECGVDIQPTWDWCHGCGFDPEGLKPAGWQPSAAPVSPAALGSGPRPGAAPPPAGPGGHPAPVGYPAPGGYPAPPGFVPPPRRGPSTGLVLGIVAAAVALLVVLPVVAIAAVTLLGRSSTSTFAPVAPAIKDPVATTAAPVTWTPWVAADKSFQIDFPCASPDTEQTPGTKDIKASSTTECSLTTEDVTYFAQTVDVANGKYIEDPNLFLDTMVTNLAEGIGRSTGGVATVRSVDKTDFAGMPSRRYTLDATVKGKSGVSEQVVIDGRLIVSGNRAYLLFASTGGGATADLERFISSFHITS